MKKMNTLPFTDINKLLSYLEISNKKNILLNSSFSLLLPFHLAKKIKKNDLSDPLFQQFVPSIKENKKVSFFSNDPLCEKDFQSGKFIKKYKNRALLLCSDNCAMNCRFCFRRHLNKSFEKGFDKELNIISGDRSLTEIILSGGDPLSLTNKELNELLQALNTISHLKTIRFHTRYIIGYPGRIDTQFLDILKRIKKQIIFVFHINHKNEIDEDVIRAIDKLKKLNILLLNQTVLLKNINDNVQTLKSLNELLISIGIFPYYLHQLDKVKGAKHFEVSIKTGQMLIKELLKETSGYLVPKYVQEIPNKKNKTPI